MVNMYILVRDKWFVIYIDNLLEKSNKWWELKVRVSAHIIGYFKYAAAANATCIG